jgi:hypothetical protein
VARELRENSLVVFITIIRLLLLPALKFGLKKLSRRVIVQECPATLSNQGTNDTYWRRCNQYSENASESGGAAMNKFALFIAGCATGLAVLALASSFSLPEEDESGI